MCTPVSPTGSSAVPPQPGRQPDGKGALRGSGASSLIAVTQPRRKPRGEGGGPVLRLLLLPAEDEAGQAGSQ